MRTRGPRGATAFHRRRQASGVRRQASGTSFVLLTPDAYRLTPASVSQPDNGGDRRGFVVPALRSVVRETGGRVSTVGGSLRSGKLATLLHRRFSTGELTR